MPISAKDGPTTLTFGWHFPKLHHDHRPNRRRLESSPLDQGRTQQMSLNNPPVRRAALGVWLLSFMVALALFLSPLTFGAVPRVPRALQALPFEGRVNQVTTADQHEPSLAVDPTNPNNLLAAAKDWRTGPKQVWNYRS